jgi:stearoyl-CoA desaturase (Delta-9 desaturase)
MHCKLFFHSQVSRISLFLGFALPMFIAGYFWGDWMGGFFIAGIAKAVFLMHCTFCINSVAHSIGEATFADERTPRDSMFVSLFTFGEGYHNFHHEFPFDYRNGLHFYDYDPGKWLIAFFHMFGLTYNLKKFDEQLFEKGKIQMQEKKILEKKNQYNWGPDKKTLREISLEEFSKRSKTEELILVDGFVYNVTKFKDSHPGGKGFITSYVGKDASVQFNGSIYNHSSAARNLLDTMADSKIK